MNNKILYIGGFALPDKNAAAQRVVGVAKSLRELGYEVTFLNSLKNDGPAQPTLYRYYDFTCYEYRRENEWNYLVTGARVISFIKKLKPSCVIAYNYPAFALERIAAYCKRHQIRCICDITEWYEPYGNFVRRNILKLDIYHRMHRVLYRLNGIIAISRYLQEIYQDKVPTVLVPPTVDITDNKWHCDSVPAGEQTTFVYAGVPSATKERLDLIYDAVCDVAQRKAVRLEVVGITAEQFCQMYGRDKVDVPYVRFWGRVDHRRVVELVSGADWAVIIRERSRVVDAGFPTKLVESISCGTPAIVNPFSNILDYLDDTNSLVTDMECLPAALEKACGSKRSPERDRFDYHRFVPVLATLFPQIGNRRATSEHISSK